MQFSITRLFVITTFIAVLLSATFGLPDNLGAFVQWIMCMFVLPPFVVVGVISSRGLRQAFFIGAMVAGLPHYLANFYISFNVITFHESMLTIETFSDFDNNYRLRNLTLIGLGCFGGLMGMLAYFSMNKNKPQNNTE